MFISKKRWMNLVNRVERMEKAINLTDTSSPLHQMKTALKEVFESDVHPNQQSDSQSAYQKSSEPKGM